MKALQSFAPNVISAQFLRAKGETLVMLYPGNEGVNQGGSASPAAKVAIASSSVAFFLVTVFIYGIYRRQNRKRHPQQQILSRRNPNRTKSPPFCNPTSKKNWQYFARLEDDNGDSSVVVSNIYDVKDEPSITWSVSDITSESGSVRSIISRGTSRLESIAEEPNLVGDTQEGPNEECEVPDYTIAYATHRSRLADLIKITNFTSTFGTYSCEADRSSEFPSLKGAKSQNVSALSAGATFETPQSPSLVTEDSTSVLLSEMPNYKFDDNKSIDTRGDEQKISTESSTPQLQEKPQSHNSSPNDTEYLSTPSRGNVDLPQSEHFENSHISDPSENQMNESMDTEDTTESEASLQLWLMTILLQLQKSKR